MSTIDVDNLRVGVNRMIGDGADVITTTGSFGECHTLFWDEFETLARAEVDVVVTAHTGDLEGPQGRAVYAARSYGNLHQWRWLR